MITNELMPLDGIEIDYKDDSKPKSLLNLVPSWLGEKIRAIPDDFLSMTEDELIDKGCVTTVERRLKTAWWFEFTRCVHRHQIMNVNAIVSAVMPVDHFRKHITTNSYKLAYIITPPPNYKTEMVDLLQIGMGQMREMLTMDNYNKDGSINSRLLDVKMKIIKDIIDRVHGQVIQRIEMKTQNVNMNYNADIENQTDDLDAQIKTLEKQLLNPTGALIDVEEKTEIPKISRKAVLGERYDAREEGVSEVRFSKLGSTEDKSD